MKGKPDTRPSRWLDIRRRRSAELFFSGLSIQTRRGYLLMPSSLTTRLRRLEARRPPVAEPPYTPPEPPPGCCEEVLRLLRDYGYLDDTLRFWLTFRTP
jgi:hypothetical protein